MKIWFDTEFIEDGKTIEPISIGMVREDGAEYYAEFEFDETGANDWVKANVFPHLDGIKRPRAHIAGDILDFVSPGGDRHGEKPEFWAYYADYDWVLLCQLYGRMIDLPDGWPMYCRDLKQLTDSMGNPKLPEQTTTEHHALADARWTRDAHLWLLDHGR